jgi:S-sulfo-L-cysteine synthase (O-acetyl-L-serine-dependent)
MSAAPHAAPHIVPGAPLLSLIGNTPLLRIRSLSTPEITICAKAEFRNPGGSVKDRPALNMILEGERTGALSTGKTILDATSGNTGIAYAMVGAAKGYPVKLCLPLNASTERKRILKAYGAEIVFTDPGEGSDGAIRRCREIYAADPEAYFYPDQYNNPANWQAHFKTTGVEIIEQTGGKLTHFVTGLGTSGTCMGVTKRLKQDLPHVRCYSAQPSSGFHGLEGMKHMPTSIVPGIFDPSILDGNLWLETEDAHAMVRRMAREEGLLIGVSSGGNLHAASLLARELQAGGEHALIVTVLCDGADKYLSEHFWDDSN